MGLSDLLPVAVQGAAGYASGQIQGQKDAMTTGARVRHQLLQDAVLELQRQKLQDALKPYDPATDNSLLRRKAEAGAGVLFRPQAKTDPYGGRSRDQYIADQGAVADVRAKARAAHPVGSTRNGAPTPTALLTQRGAKLAAVGRAIAKAKDEAGAGQTSAAMNQAAIDGGFASYQDYITQARAHVQALKTAVPAPAGAADDSENEDNQDDEEQQSNQ